MYKPCEFYGKMRDAYGEEYSSQKYFTNGITRVLLGVD